MVDCVSISTNHLFAGNPIYEQHRLRHECIVQRQSWNVPTIRNMEALEKVRDRTGIRETVLNYGDDMEYRRAA
jgi:N-acyl-L-homoserine lactone synthetase